MYIWIILIGVMVASFIIQKVLQRKFDKYSDVPSPGGLSGAEVARLMLERNGIRGVEVVSIDGKLTDHYNPKDSTINLSRDVYAGRSVGIAGRHNQRPDALGFINAVHIGQIAGGGRRHAGRPVHILQPAAI